MESTEATITLVTSVLDGAALDRLHPFGDAVAVLLFGSVARGDQDDHSDVDSMIVVDDQNSAATLQRSLRAHGTLAVLPTVRTIASLLDEARERPSFIAHLVDEAVVIRSSSAWPMTRDRLARLSTDPDALDREVRRRLRHLESFSRPERFRLSPVTALSHLWAVARSLVIVRLLQQGVHEYSWQRAFDRYAALRPELRADLDALQRLRPYYEVARGRPGARLPAVDPNQAEVARLVVSVEQIAA